MVIGCGLRRTYMSRLKVISVNHVIDLIVAPFTEGTRSREVQTRVGCPISKRTLHNKVIS